MTWCFFFFFLSPSSGCACHLGFLQALMCLPEGRKYHATVLKCVASLRKELNFASFRYGLFFPPYVWVTHVPNRISDTTMGAGSSSFCFGFVVSVIKFETKQLEKRSRNPMDCKQFLCATVVQDFRCGWRPKQLEVTNQMRSSRKGNQTLLRLILWLVCRRPTMQWATPGRLVRSQLGLFEQQI